MVVTFRLKPTADRGGGPLECIRETVGTIHIPAVALSQHIGADTKNGSSYLAARGKMCVYRGTSSEKRSGPEVLCNQKNVYSGAGRLHTDCMDATNTTIASDMGLRLRLYAQNV